MFENKFLVANRQSIVRLLTALFADRVTRSGGHGWGGVAWWPLPLLPLSSSSPCFFSSSPLRRFLWFYLFSFFLLLFSFFICWISWSLLLLSYVLLSVLHMFFVAHSHLLYPLLFSILLLSPSDIVF